MNGHTMIPGTKLTLSGVEYLIPPLNLAALRKHKDFLAKAMKGVKSGEAVEPGDDDFEVILDIVFMAIKRNYPNLTLETLAEQLDMGNMTEAMTAVMKTSGFQEAEPGK